MSWKTKSYAERLTAAIAKSDAEADPEQAVYVMKCALQKEIKLANEIESMASFRAWFEGERFDVQMIRGRK